MAFEMVHTDKFKKSANIKSALTKSFNFYIARYISDGEFLECEIYQPTVMADKLLASPIAYNVKSTNVWTSFDIYTGKVTDETLNILGSELNVLDDKVFKVPYINLSFENIICDYLISSFLNLCKNDYEASYCYLRVAQFMLSIANEKSKEFIQDSFNSVSKQVSLYSI